MSKTNEIKSLIDQSGKLRVDSVVEGGMCGYAFVVHHILLDRRMFAKVIDVDEEAAKTFSEPRALMDAIEQSGSENLVRLHDTQFLDAERLLMVMEFVEGGSLESYIETHAVGQMDAVKIMMGTLVGVAQLHCARYLHRDLKPGNILLKLQPALIAKVGDFGSVRKLQEGETRVNASKHSAIYRPPEAWGEQGWCGVVSDIYQLGMCLHELINGPLQHNPAGHLDRFGQAALRQAGCASLNELHPCDASLIVDGCVMRSAQAGKILASRQPQAYQAKVLAKIIRKATSVDPSDRYQDALEFRIALQSVRFPNWKKEGDDFTADGWNGYDWFITRSNPSSEDWRALRKRVGTDVYRTKNYGSRSLSQIFAAIESCE